MTRTTSLLQRLTLALALAAWASPAAAAPTPALEALPPELKPWVPWVLAKHKYDFCTHLLWGQAGIQCAWPSRLELRVDPKGGRFRQSWHMDQGGFVPLPGDKQHFPLDVQGNAGALAVVDRGDDGPFVELPAGDHTVSGNFLWDSPPDHLRIPEASGLVSVFLDGKPVTLPPRQNSGDLWLRPTNDDAPQAQQEADALSIVVHRHLADTIPLELTTRVTLRVAGKAREVLLAQPLPDGWTPLSLASPLPSRLEPDGRWRVQVRPGEFTLTLKARGAGPVDTIRRPTPNGPWTSEAEIWAFEAHPELRVTALEGVTALDPTQTNLPEEWASLPAYAVPLEAPVTLSEKLRQGSNPPPDQLKLSRDYWLDFDGASYTFRDRVTGTISRGSRLDMGPQATLGRVVLNNRDRLVTKQVGGLGAGVEVPSGPLLVQAEGRVESFHSSVPAVAWNHDFQAVTGRLHLPQGYKLLHATGVDLVQGTWLQSWTLFDLFMVLVSTMAVARLYGRAWGILALVLLSLSFQEEGAPQSLWLFFLAFEAITRVLPGGRVQTASVWARGFFFLLLTLNSLPFLLAHLRHGLYPALDPVSALPGYARVTPEMLLEGGKQEPAILRVPAPPSHWPKLLNREEYGSDAEALRPVPLGHAQPSKDAKAMGDDAEAPPGQSTEQTMDLAESAGRPPGVALNKAMVLQGAPSSSASPAPSQAQALDLLDARAKVQTGPGIPSWNGHLHFWQFHGPVNKGQEMRFIVLTPTMNLVLAMVQTVLLLALLLRLFPWRNFPSWWRPQAMATASLTALLFLVLPSNALAQPVGDLKPHTPELSLLDQLEQRLLTQHECHPSCASAGRLSLRVDAHTIHGRLEVDATIAGAVPLPGHREHWLPSVVLVDGKPATALRIHDDGHLWVGVSAGRHQLVVEGPLPERTSVQLGLPLMPHKVLFESKAWTLKGVHEDGAIDEALELVYAPTETGTEAEHAPGQAATLRAAPLPPLLRVERTLTLGMDWSVETHVVRVSPTGSPARLEVALLPGEAVTTSDILVRQGRVEVSLLPDATEVSWKSSIAAATDLALIATEDPVAVEEWTLLSIPTWHVGSEGIPFQSEPGKGGLRAQTWHPWPGEKVSLKISRPEMSEGPSLTLDRALYTFYPGLRSSEGTVEVNLRSSQGTTHALTLPEGAELVELRTGDVVQPLRQEGRRVPIAVNPGANYAFVKFRVPVGLSTALRVPAIDLGAPAVNVETRVQGLGDRWLVYLKGPRLGPAILYWSLLVVLAVLGGILSRAKTLPLGALGWFALTIGLSQVGWASGAVVVGWFVVMDLRGRFGHEGGSPLGFNARQGALVLWTYWALSTLLDAVKAGLLGKPDMQLAGNGSTVETLTWFQDRVAAVPESPLVISCPMLVYRGLMLLWALWLAWALLHWVRWAWTCFSQGGLWRPLRKPRGMPSRDEIEPTETPTPEPQG